jgi:hypothetical protein
VKKIGNDCFRKGSGHSYKRIRKLKRILPKVSKKSKVRLEGIRNLGEIVASQNPVVSTLLTMKDTGVAISKVATGKQPKFPRMI